MAELADARDLGSRAARCAGSIPVTRTISSVHNGIDRYEHFLYTLVFGAAFTCSLLVF